MLDYKAVQANVERYKDFAREAANERFARENCTADAGLVATARSALGRRLITLGQQLLNAPA